ncbi:MAG: CopD family protein [Paracoccaceae bacterium]
MTELLLDAVPLFKAVHVAALALWCGGLLALPLMLAWHDPAISADDYRIVRRATHLTYTICVTPAAVIAVIVGTWLIFLRDVFVPWLYAKLVLVALLVAVHAWIGRLLDIVAETPGERRAPRPLLPSALVLVPVLGILGLVLAKPGLSGVALPDWLGSPRGGQLPFDVPSR